MNLISMDELLAKYLGTYVYETGFGYQCVGWVKRAWKELYGVNLGSFGGSAKFGWQNNNGTFDGFVRSTGIPDTGDMVFFRAFEPYWHVGIALDTEYDHIKVIEQNGETGTGTGVNPGDAIRINDYSYSNYIGCYKAKSSIPDDLIGEAIEKGYYNGVEGDGLTDRVVLSFMKAIKGEIDVAKENLCPHVDEIISFFPPQPKDGVITYRVHNETTDMHKVIQEIIFNNCFTWIREDLPGIYYKRVYEGEADINIRFAYPGDPQLPAPFKKDSIAYAIMPLREVWINDSQYFTRDFTQRRLLSVLDHELRHIHGVEHVDDPDDIMYYQYHTKEISSHASRKQLRDNYPGYY